MLQMAICLFIIQNIKRTPYSASFIIEEVCEVATKLKLRLRDYPHVWMIHHVEGHGN